MKIALLLVTVLGATATAQPAPQTPATPSTPAAPASPANPSTPTAPATPAEPAAPATPATPVTPATPPAELAKDEPKVDAAPELPKKLAVGTKGVFNPGLLAQAWFQNERAGDRTQVSQFRLRRAEISVAGEILPKTVAYKVMFDPSKVRETTKTTVAGPPDAMGNPTTVTINNPSSAISVLQDFYITGLSKYVDVSIGQFKIPVSWEGYNSSGKLLFPERAVVSSTFGDKRDLGIRLEKKFKQVGYSAGVFNGSGLNSFDNNVQKDLALRLEVYPVPGLTIAGVTYDSVGIRQRAGTKDRWELDARYESGPIVIQGEAIVSRDVTKDQTEAVPGRGMYVLAGYTIKDPALPMHGELQPVVRWGAFDPNTTNDPAKMTDKDALMHFDVGVNYYLQKHEMKLQAAYQRTQYQADMKPANNEVIIATQVMF